MRWDAFGLPGGVLIDIIQSCVLAVEAVVLIFVAGGLAYLIWRLEREIRTAAKSLRAVLNQQQDLNERINAIEEFRNSPSDRAETLVRFRRVIDAMADALRERDGAP